MLANLWAGWRAAYVEETATAPAPSPGDGSVFTRILASGEPDDVTLIVWRGEHVFAILNAYPYTNGHVLVLPYREVAAIEDLSSPEHDELWASVRAAVIAVKGAYAPDGVNVGMNLGRAAGAGVPTHLHVHVLPRWAGDTNVMTSVANLRVMPEDLATTYRRVRAAWPDGPRVDAR